MSPKRVLCWKWRYKVAWRRLRTSCWLGVDPVKASFNRNEPRNSARTLRESTPHQDSERDDKAEFWELGALPEPSSRSSKDGLEPAVGCGLGRPGESSGLGPPMGLPLATLRELAQSTLPSLREGSRRAGPQQQSRPGGDGRSVRQVPRPAWAALVPAPSGRRSEAGAMSRLGHGGGRRARQDYLLAQAALEPVSRARTADIP